MASKKARVLVDALIDGKECKVNDVITLEDDQIKAYAGQVDPHPDAVKHAEKLAAAAAEAAKQAKG